jgi:heme-degrading monooxygenase HmoA
MAGAYQTHVTTVVFPKLMAIDGYLGGRVLRRTTDDYVEFVVCTDWASWAAIRAFAGETPDRAVVEPEARAVLHDFDAHVQHFEVVHEVSRSRGGG